MDKITVAAASIMNFVGNPDQNFARIQKWTQSAAESGANLVLFPELCISGYITAPIAHDLAEPVPGPSTEKMIALAETHGLFIAFGLIEKASDHFCCSHVLV
jgi:predicted amidohydrolase